MKNTKNTKWKVPVIVAVGVVAVILMIIFGVQSTKKPCYCVGGTGKYSTVGY